MKMEDVRQNIPENLLPLLDDFLAKFKFVSSNHLEQLYDLLVLTQCHLQALAKHLVCIPESLKVVCIFNN